jgi:hypothetical protein
MTKKYNLIERIKNIQKVANINIYFQKNTNKSWIQSDKLYSDFVLEYIQECI